MEEMEIKTQDEREMLARYLHYDHVMREQEMAFPRDFLRIMTLLAQNSLAQATLPQMPSAIASCPQNHDPPTEALTGGRGNQ